MSNPAKKFKIRPPLRPSFKDHGKSLQLICDAIEIIYAKKASTLSFEEIYRSAYYLVLDSSGSVLYKEVLNCFSTLLKKETQKLSGMLPTTTTTTPSFTYEEGEHHGGVGFLKLILTCWEHFCICLKMTSDVLMYMDKMYCQANSKPLVKEAGMQLFRDVLLRSTLAPIRSTLRNCLLHSIQHERNGNIIDSSLMKNILDMLLTLGDSLVDGIDAHPPTCVHGEIIEAGSVYTVDFETAFLTHTQTYYEHEVETKAHHGSVAEYLKHCEQRLDEENDRVARYLSPTTLTPLIHITEVTLLQSPMSRLIDQGVLPMLQTKKYDDLHRFYKLAKRVSNGLSQLSDALSKFMSSHSPGLLDLLMSSQQAKDPTLVFLEWTHQVFQLHTHLRTLYTTSFQSDPRLEKVMQTTLSETINKQALLASEAVSACLDHGLRKKGGTLMTDVHLETTALVPCIEVFAYLNEKDAFATYFHHAQSQRLVAWKPGMSEDLEQWVLHQLRTLCGSQFTCKFEKKWIDLHTSMDLAQQFHRMHQAQLGSLEVHVNVLTSSLWPSSTLSSLLSSSSSSSASTSLSTLVPLPSPFKEVMVLFESFYASVHTNRILTWQPQWGSGEVRGYFKQIHDLTINTYGIILLLQFNQRDSFTMEELLMNTQLPEDELIRYLLSLSLGKYKLLIKFPATKQVHPKDTFTLNHEFKEKRMKLKIPLISTSKSTDAHQKAGTLLQLQEERSSVIDAVLVRVMKSRKRMHHAELMAEVIKHLVHRFVPPPPLIKKRIENLMERDFLERDSKDPSVYLYVA